MVVYFVALGASFLLARVAESRNKSDRPVSLPRKWNFAAFSVAALLITISALRWGVGTDYWNYHSNFSIYAQQFVDEFSIFGEPGIRFFAWLGMQINADSATMFALAAIMTIGLTIRTLWKWSPAFAFSVVLYILIGDWTGSFNGVRQYLAGAVLFAGHRYVIKRQVWKWLAVVFVAMLFHISAIVALLMYFVPTKRTSFAIQLGILVLGLVGMLGAGSILDFLAEYDAEGGWDGSYANRAVNPVRIAFAFVPLLLYWLLANQTGIENYNSWFYINMLAVYASAFLVSASSAMMARFVIYVSPFVILGIVAATSVKSARDRLIVRVLAIIMYGIFFYIDTFAFASTQQFQWLFDRP